MSEKYSIGDWQAFVQQIQYLVSRGYVEYCLIKYPEHKTDKFLKIDRKLIQKYNCNLNKDKTYYNKKKGYCNFKFLRWGDTGIFLKTKGIPNEKLVVDDVFLNVKKEKINIIIGEQTVLNIGYDEENKATVFLNKDSYRNVKAVCFQHIDSKNFRKAASTFNNLNGLPAWGGIVRQKIKLKGQIISKMKKNVSVDQTFEYDKKMKINTKRTPVKVF